MRTKSRRQAGICIVDWITLAQEDIMETHTHLRCGPTAVEDAVRLAL